MLALLLTSFALSVFLTYAVRAYAVKANVIDIPNERSSHVAPTPRGGGVAIVATFLIALLVTWNTLEVSSRPLIALCAGGLLIALVGFYDDHRHIPAKWRLGIHFLGAIVALIAVGAPPVLLFSTSYDLSFAGYALSALFLVWMLNLYNFMDGIDGIAGIEAVTTTYGASAILALVGAPLEHWAIPLILGTAALGFLVWNFPPAKIFMGDAGSGFLGFSLGAISLWNAHFDPALLWSWVILLGVFIVDATSTLVRRLYQGDRVYEAHRTHAYQKLARSLGKHRPVSVAVGAINILWLCPWAWLAATHRLDGLLATVIAYIPLVVLAIRYKAGVAEK